MQLEYEISEDDYVASQRLFWKLSYGRKRFKNPVSWILIGAFYIAIALERQIFDLVFTLLAGAGAFWIWNSMWILFPESDLRRVYRGLDWVGKRFRAELNAEGFEVVEEFETNRIRWAGLKIKGENEQVVILCQGPGQSLHMFGKKYMTAEQQHEFRKLAGMNAK
jgi:hypothetical protein